MQNKLQYTAENNFSGALHLTSKERPYNELGWETIQSRTEFLGLSFSHKVEKIKQGPLSGNAYPPGH